MRVFHQFTLQEKNVSVFEKRHFLVRFGLLADNQTSQLDICQGGSQITPPNNWTDENYFTVRAQISVLG